MKVSLLRATEKPEELIEFAGRVCYQSHDKGPNPKIIQNWIKSGHESTIEHASASFYIDDVSITLMKQMTRHRMASFSIISFRHVTATDFEYVIPVSVKENPEIELMFNNYMTGAMSFYKMLRNLGIPKEDARMAMPEAMTTKIVLTMNFRELRHFFNLRAHKSSQWEIRDLANEMLNLVCPLAPNVFSDIKEKLNESSV